jgi:pectate lyase
MTLKRWKYLFLSLSVGSLLSVISFSACNDGVCGSDSSAQTFVGNLDLLKSVVVNHAATPASTSMTLYNLFGFAAGTTGGGTIAETDAAYAKVATPQELCDALYSWYKAKQYTNTTTGKVWGGTTGVKVIEITANLNLGYLEVGTSVTGSTSGGLLTNHATPKLHPVLIASGVSKLDIKSKSGLTIFSKTGATIKHCTFNIKSTNNIIIRNLKFDEMWEWDEASKGNYDKDDYDFIDLSNGGVAYNVWIDHCTFTKAYDGVVDMKAGTYNVTISWCKYLGDDGATNSSSFVRQQITKLEASKSSYAFYNFLRTTAGFTQEEIIAIIQGQDKTHLIGATSQDSSNSSFLITLHHDWFINPWDRLPRLRGGQVHVYNIYADDTLALAAKRLRDTRVAAMSTANQNTINNTYNFNPPINGTISTEGGAILVEKSAYIDVLWPLRNNQTDITDSTYTGKVLALDSVYKFDNTDGSSVTLRGDSTDTSVFPAVYTNGTGVMGPAQAAVISFSWNTSSYNTSGLPYSYYVHDPATELKTALTNGCGSGVLSLSATQWMSVSY